MKFPELVLIPQQHVNAVWNLCEEFIAAALDGTELSPEQARDRAANGQAQLWFVWSDRVEAAAITELWNTPSGKVCAILALGGKNMSRWFGLFDQFEIWARKEGVKIIRFFGRKGLARVMRDFEITRIVMDKEL